MIWSHRDASQPDGVSLEAHLLQEIHTLCGDTVSEPIAAEVAHGIAAYWKQILHDVPLAPDYIAFLVARAMRTIGADAAAEAAMRNQHDPSLGSELLQYLPVGEVSLYTWRMFTSLLVRPTRWTSFGDDVVWILDFSRLNFGDDHCFELSFTESLRGVLLQLAAVWSQADGQGALGIRGADLLSSVLGGRSGSEAEAYVVELCRDILRSEAEKREWSAVPRVVLIDAAVGKPSAKKTSCR